MSRAKVRANYNRVSNSVKIAFVTALSTIAVALIGAWQVAASTGSGLTRDEVRQLIHQESPVNDRGATELFQTLIRIDSNVTQLKVNEAIDHTLIEQLAKGK